MIFRQIAGTQLRVSALGFGALGIGNCVNGEGYGASDDMVSREAIAAAIDLGCNFFDTADIYGLGHSEQLLGTTLRQLGRLNEAVIASKGGFIYDGKRGAQDFSPAYLTLAVEKSLRRLRREYIDLYQLHNPPLSVLTDALGERLHDLVGRGKVRYFGVSVHSPEEARVWALCPWISSVQIVYNYFCLFLPHLTAESLVSSPDGPPRIAFIAREPLANGFLTNSDKPGRQFADNDLRSEFTVEDCALRRKLADTLDWSNALGLSRSQVALRFVLDEPTFSSTVVGIKSAQQAIENFSAVEMEPFSNLYYRAQEMIARKF